jgi:plastocyanin
LAAVVGLLLGACTSSATSPPVSGAGPSLTVTIVDYGYEPDAATAAPGTTVTFTNTGRALHNVHWTDGSGAGPNLATGDEYQRSFDAPGTYAYLCDLHPLMTGSITIVE